MQQGTPKSPTTPPPPASPNRSGIHPAWKWILPPLVALVFLGAYRLGMMASQPPEAPPTGPNMTITPAPAPPQPPQGRIDVTEVPYPTTTPSPVVNPNPQRPASGQTAQTPAQPPKPKVEAPVVLPKPPPRAEPVPAPSSTTEPVKPDNANTLPDAPATGPETGGESRDPVQINNPAQEYPSSAYEEGAQGSVRVVFTISRDGVVEDPRVDRTSGDDRLDRAAVQYVSRLKFRPALEDGKPVSVPASRVIQFSLR